MAKCPSCDTRKGKRKCLIFDDFICSLCCGNIRKEETCLGCIYYQPPKRKYTEVPSYTLKDMLDNPELEPYSNTIEGTLCALDQEHGYRLRDSDAISILESLIDIYHYKDDQVQTDRDIISIGVKQVEHSIKNDLPDFDDEILVKVLAVLRFVARRRTQGNREYMRVIHQYVGQRIDSGVRLLGSDFPR